MKRIVIIISLLLTVSLYAELNTEYKVIKSGEVTSISHKLDINSCSYDDMISRGIRKSVAQKLIEYREITGGFKRLAEMKRINGIGKATYEKIKELFEISTPLKLKRFNINNADDMILNYYGFTKKEIKKIREFQNKNGKIRNSLELKKIVSKQKYEKLADLIDY